MNTQDELGSLALTLNRRLRAGSLYDAWSHQLGSGYEVKYDGLRKHSRWTLLAPDGTRVCDCFDAYQVVDAIYAHIAEQG